MKITELQLLIRELKPICQTGISDNQGRFLSKKPIYPVELLITVKE